MSIIFELKDLCEAVKLYDKKLKNGEFTILIWV